MKTIYFVRHGESEGNASDKYQFDSSELSVLGRKQAQQIAERSSHLAVQLLIASTMPRAQQTAEAISHTTGLLIRSSELFVERKRPRTQQGLVRTSPEAKHMDQEIIKSSCTPGYRFADEENFNDLSERSAQTLYYLASQEEESIIVVTHGLFLRVLLAQVTFGAALTGEMMNAFLSTYQTSNTGLTVFTYDEEKNNPWNVLIWNDSAHLG